MARNENQNQTSVVVKKACSDHPSPSSGCHGRNRGRSGRHEEEKENRRGDPQPPKPQLAARHFMSPTISASMKKASPRNDQPVLVERNEAAEKKPLLGQDLEPSTHPFNVSTPTTPLPAKDSKFTVQDPGDCRPNPVLPPYDPFVNYLSPRPRFLRYNPNRRLERMMREIDAGQEEVDSEKKKMPAEETESSSSETGDSVSCQSNLSDDQAVPPTIENPPSSPIMSVSEGPIAAAPEDESPSENAVDDEPVEETPLEEMVADNPVAFVEHSAEEIKAEESMELEEEEEIEEEEEEEERRWWRPRWVFESVLILGLLILAPLLVSYMCSSSGVAFRDAGVGEEGLLMEIYDPLPHPSRFSFENLRMNRRFINSWPESYDLGPDQVNVSFFLREPESGGALLDAVVQSDQTSEVNEEAVVQPDQTSELEEEAAVSTMGLGLELGSVEMVEEKNLKAQVTTCDNVFNDDDDHDGEGVVGVEEPLSNKLSLPDTVALSLEPVCNTYGITSTSANKLGMPPQKALLFPLKTTLLAAAFLLSLIIFLKFIKRWISSLVSTNHRNGNSSASTSTSTRKSPRRSSMSSSNQDSSWMSMSSYGSITVQKEVKLKQEVVSTPVRRSTRLLNRNT